MCELFAVEYHVTFNESKTFAIKFGSKSQTAGHVVLNGNHIKWKQDVKHLVNIVSAVGTDTNDCILKRSQFIGAVNKLIGNFGHVPTQLSCQLFTTYCCSFYGSQLWGANPAGFKRCITNSSKAYDSTLCVMFNFSKYFFTNMKWYVIFFF